MLNLIVPSLSRGTLDAACEAEPGAVDLLLIRCAFFCELASTMRGTKTSNHVTEESFYNAGECIQGALSLLEPISQLDAQDPTPFAYVLPCLRIFGQLKATQQRVFQQATELAPDLAPAYRTIVNSLSERWGGSHEESLQFARFAMTKGSPGGDMALCLFWAHLLVQSHFATFDKSPAAARRYVRNPEVIKELEAAFDSWIKPPYHPRRSSIPYLHYAACWFYLSRDHERLGRALSLINNVFYELPWSYQGNARKMYILAVQFAAGKAPTPNSEANWLTRLMRSLTAG
jgi:hypothetical protein